MATCDLRGVVTSKDEPVPGVQMRVSASKGGLDHPVGEPQTGPDGTFGPFSFEWDSAPTPQDPLVLAATFSLLVNGSWEPLTRPDTGEPVMRTYDMTSPSGTWHITDIPIPEDALIARAKTTGKSKDPFWRRVGLVPLDDDHVRNGLVTDANPKLKIQDQPFGGVLNIFAVFEVTDKVASYTAELVPVRPDGSHGASSPITDALVNSYWDNTGPYPRWVSVNLCPPPTGRYTNIDNDTRTWLYPKDWKLSWDSRRLADGRYRIIITYYDSMGKGANRPYYPTPMLRISNKPPYLTLDTVSDVGVCGAAAVDASRIIQFKVTITHNEGDVRSPRFSATRGPGAEPAGDLTKPIELPKPHPDWGPLAATLDFKVKPTTCPAMAYSFSLFVYGAATNCVSQYLYWVQKTMNLVVATPQVPTRHRTTDASQIKGQVPNRVAGD